MERAIECGWLPDEISYTGTNVSERDLDVLLANRVHVNLDAISQIRRYGRRARGRTIGLRIDPGAGAGYREHLEYSGRPTKFGIGLDRLEEACEIIRSLWTEPRTTFAGRHYTITDALAEPKPLQERVLEARRLFREQLPAELAGAVAFFESDRYTSAASLQDNILFGKVAYGQAQANERISDLIAEVLADLDLAVARPGHQPPAGAAAADLAVRGLHVHVALDVLHADGAVARAAEHRGVQTRHRDGAVAREDAHAQVAGHADLEVRAAVSVPAARDVHLERQVVALVPALHLAAPDGSAGLGQERKAAAPLGGVVGPPTRRPPSITGIWSWSASRRTNRYRAWTGSAVTTTLSVYPPPCRSNSPPQVMSSSCSRPSRRKTSASGR